MTPAMPRESKHWSTALEVLDACEDGVAWARTQPTLAEAWETCERADWMLWLLGHNPTVADHQRLVLIACECARTVLHLVVPGENRPHLAIEAAEAWAARAAVYAANATSAANAANAAVYAANAANATSAANAANAAAYAADAVSAASAANAAAYAADAVSAASAASDAAWNAVRDAALKDYCQIVRRYFPNPPKLEASHATRK